MQFWDAAHMWCFVHFCSNLQAKLRELGVSAEVKRCILADAFVKKTKGSDTEELECAPSCGLVNMQHEDEFEDTLASLKDRWNIQVTESRGKPVQFYPGFSH